MCVCCYCRVSMCVCVCASVLIHHCFQLQFHRNDCGNKYIHDGMHFTWSKRIGRQGMWWLCANLAEQNMRKRWMFAWRKLTIGTFMPVSCFYNVFIHNTHFEWVQENCRIFSPNFGIVHTWKHRWSTLNWRIHFVLDVKWKIWWF